MPQGFPLPLAGEDRRGGNYGAICGLRGKNKDSIFVPLTPPLPPRGEEVYVARPINKRPSPLRGEGR